MWMDHEGLKWGWGEHKDESGELIGRGALLAETSGLVLTGCLLAPRDGNKRGRCS